MIYIIISTYNQNKEKGLVRLFRSLVYQTDKNFYVEVVHDGPDQDRTKDLVKQFSYLLDVSYTETPKREDYWGHNCREVGLLNSPTNIEKPYYIHYTNGDNEYERIAIERFNHLAKTNAEILLANIKHSYFNYGVLEVQFKEASCDFMNMCIRSDIAQSMGFPYRNYAADAWLIRDINNKYKLNIAKTSQIIGTHH